ncbi:tyrosine-protein kinase family protein [Calditrichota bacterium]
MDTFQLALKKAKDQGKISSRHLPWEKSNSDNGKTSKFNPQNIELPPQLEELPNDLINDFQKTIENLRTEAGKKSLQVIGVTSAIDAQGNSTFISILALLLAAIERADYEQFKKNNILQKHKNTAKPGVLLLDTQVRNPSLHKKLGISQRGGLVEIFENEIPFHKAIKSVKGSSLKMISMSQNNHFQFTPKHLNYLKSYLDILKTKIGFILLDIPPILKYSEGMALSKLCDGIIIVIGAGETRWQMVQEAEHTLKNAEVNIIGTVLNKRKFFTPDWLYKRL